MAAEGDRGPGWRGTVASSRGSLRLRCDFSVPKGSTKAQLLEAKLSTLPALWSPLGDSLPMSITGHAHALLSGAWGVSALPRPLLGGLLLATVCTASACLALRRQEA